MSGKRFNPFNKPPPRPPKPTTDVQKLLDQVASYRSSTSSTGTEGSDFVTLESYVISQAPPADTYIELCSKFIPPQVYAPADSLQPYPIKHQVSGHLGFLIDGKGTLYKPLNLRCVRGRRELLFYQLLNYYVHHPNERRYYYSDFNLFIDPRKRCDCLIDPETMTSFFHLTAGFKHPRHKVETNDDDFATNPTKQKRHFDALYSDYVYCPCYGDDLVAKLICSVKEPQDFIGLQDLTVHCKIPCILDVKVGRVTYDPISHPLKRVEQILKYEALRDFGFRIMGMIRGDDVRGKAYGKSLETQEQVFEAIESFYLPLRTNENRAVVIDRVLDRIESILEWFETKNSNQLRFYASSIIITYDLEPVDSTTDSREEIHAKLRNSVRVAMVDFAHVFHSHVPPVGPSRSGSERALATSEEENKDDNYLYGLRRLVKFYIMLCRQYRGRAERDRAERAQRELLESLSSLSSQRNR